MDNREISYPYSQGCRKEYIWKIRKIVKEKRWKNKAGHGGEYFLGIFAKKNERHNSYE